MKKFLLILVCVLLICPSIAKASTLHGTIWQYGDNYDRIGFYNNDIYILIDPDIAYPDPPYWNNVGISFFLDFVAITYFIETLILPLG